MKLFGKTWTKRKLLERIGHVSQVGGIRRFALADGPERGVEAATVDTGTGFVFTVLLNRGLDVFDAKYHGQSLAWHSATGATHPAMSMDHAARWLRTFPGGLVTTCGLAWAGHPNVDEGEALGLHGRASSLSGESLSVRGVWEGDDYLMRIEGQVRETENFGPNLLLRRRITAKLGEPKLVIEDVLENEGWRKEPFQLLYHCNFGHPLLGESTRLVIPTKRAILRETKREVPPSSYLKIPAPQKGFVEEVYYHEVPSGKTAEVRLERKGFGIPTGRGAYARYSRDTLPLLNQWKMVGQGMYVVGIEPATCRTEGRAKDRADGILQLLDPGESRRFKVEIGIL